MVLQGKAVSSLCYELLLFQPNPVPDPSLCVQALPDADTPLCSPTTQEGRVGKSHGSSLVSIGRELWGPRFVGCGLIDSRRQRNRLLLGMAPCLHRLFTHRKEVQLEEAQRGFLCTLGGMERGGWEKKEGSPVNDHLY